MQIDRSRRAEQLCKLNFGRMKVPHGDKRKTSFCANYRVRARERRECATSARTVDVAALCDVATAPKFEIDFWSSREW